MIVGLGNPGPRYAGTRHNVGFDVVDALAKRWSLDLSREKFHAWFADGSIHDERVVLLKPTTLMNRSGDAVLSAGRFFQLGMENLLVVLDDWALPVGKLRIRPKGSGGSHNGLGNVIDRIGFSDFARMRIGIGEPVGVPSDYVLTRFAPDEAPIIKQAVETAADAAECWVRGGVEDAMNRYNAKGKDE